MRDNIETADEQIKNAIKMMALQGKTRVERFTTIRK